MQARIQSRNEYGFSAESVLDLFQTFDIREASTQATTDLFQKIGENTYYQDAPTTKKDLHVINSEPLSTNSEKGDKKIARCLKILKKVSFNIASEASYVYIMSGQKLIKNAKSDQFWRVLKT